MKLPNTKLVYQGLTSVQGLQQNPFNFAVDNIIRLVVRYLIPVPFASELVIYFKGPILVLLAGGALLFITIIFIIITIIFTPASTINSIVHNFTGTIPIGENLQVIIQALEGYIEAGFIDTQLPIKDPFGGIGESYSIRTAGFHDPGYYLHYGLIHNGQDIVPSQAYYNENNGYRLTGQPIVYATLSGKATTYTDSYGSLTVAITNNAGTMQTVYMHFKQILACNCDIHAGQPIGIMGDTGFADGVHLHYEVRQNEGGKWVAVNPLDYIK